MKRYVSGMIFNMSLDRVLMISNEEGSDIPFIDGQCFPKEDLKTVMKDTCKNECGLSINDWEFLICLSSNKNEISFFYSCTPYFYDYIKHSINGRTVEDRNVNDLPSNLRYIADMAATGIRNEREKIMKKLDKQILLNI